MSTSSDCFRTLHIMDTIYSADSVEWCPFSPYKSSLVCGTYHLIEGNQEHDVELETKGYQRTGSLTVYTVLKDKLEKNHSYECPAVLDIKWCGNRIDGEMVLAVANAVGEVCVFYFQDRILKFVSKCELLKDGGELLILSLDWAKDSSNLICTSDSKGNITLIHFLNSALCVIKEWNAHSLEAWTTCFDSFNSNVIISGGDEAKLKVWDYRCEGSVVSSTKHESGVTALNSNVFKEFNFVSGSYDESVLFWDTRNWSKPVEKIIASGGVWRLKWETKIRCRYILAACIYGGFQIYDTDCFSIVAEYKEHESLAYGADWCHLDNSEAWRFSGSNESALVATCSFYDHKLCVSFFDELRVCN